MTEHDGWRAWRVGEDCPLDGEVEVINPNGMDRMVRPATRLLSALSIQEGGDHYKSKAIQPVEYIHANAIGYFEGNVIKYVSRWRDKNGIDDLKKARHYLEILIELELRQPRIK